MQKKKNLTNLKKEINTKKVQKKLKKNSNFSLKKKSSAGTIQWRWRMAWARGSESKTKI